MKYIIIFIECDEINPSTGHFQCDCKYLASGSACHFKCPEGMLPKDARTSVCIPTFDETGNVTSFDWDTDISKFGCVSTIR